MAMIKVNSVSKLYRTSKIETMALDNVNFSIEKGEFVSIMGPSGCGKSTLLNIVGLLDRPTTGTVEIGGKTAVGMGDRALAAFRNASIGFIFQNFHLIPSLSVADNVELPFASHKPFPLAAVGRSVPACCHRPCNHRQPRHHSRRRTYRQPRLAHECRNHGYIEKPQRGRPHNPHGDPQ